MEGFSPFRRGNEEGVQVLVFEAVRPRLYSQGGQKFSQIRRLRTDCLET
jgi:hypothetical protein